MRRYLVVIAGLSIVGMTVLSLTAVAGGEATLVTKMNGAKEVSSSGEKGVGDEDGFGRARIRLRPDEGRVCFRLSWANIAAPTASHIHEGGPDTAGPVVVTLFAGENPLPATLSAVRGCATDVERDVIDRIKSDPANYYVNVHNSDFPGGAIRGQLRKSRR